MRKLWIIPLAMFFAVLPGILFAEELTSAFGIVNLLRGREFAVYTKNPANCKSGVSERLCFQVLTALKSGLFHPIEPLEQSGKLSNLKHYSDILSECGRLRKRASQVKSNLGASPSALDTEPTSGFALYRLSHSIFDRRVMFVLRQEDEVGEYATDDGVFVPFLLPSCRSFNATAIMKSHPSSPPLPDDELEWVAAPVVILNRIWLLNIFAINNLHYAKRYRLSLIEIDQTRGYLSSIYLQEK